MKHLVLVTLIAGCSMGSDGQGVSDGGMGGTDAPAGCIVLTFAPPNPVAGDHVKVSAQVFRPGVAHYHWQVDGVDNTSYESPQQDAIGFDVPTAMAHEVTLDVDLADNSPCQQGQAFINVASGSNVIVPYRLRVTPPSSVAPPQEQILAVQAGAQIQRPVYLDPGIELDATIQDASGSIPAYVKLTPAVGPAIDLVTLGSITPRVQLLAHTILVVPMDNTLAPRTFTWMPGVGPNSFTVDAGAPVTGTVVDRAGTPLANAQVQLTQAGVPSTIATTNASGAFTARVSFGSTSQTTITVTPPAGAGLAKLSATSQFDLGQPIAVSFAPSPATCDLGGTAVKRGGTNQPGAIVSIVGAVANAGTIAGVAAAGQFHATATATAGTLPSLLVPRAQLSAVAQVAAADYAVATIDTTACTAQTIDAPARIGEAGRILGTDGTTPLSGVRIEATPTGALGQVTLVPVEAVTAGDGSWSALAASGATYEVRVIDPSGRGALSPGAFPTGTVALANALSIKGQIGMINGGNIVEGASVQLLCAPGSAGCSGLAAQQPIAETATDITGYYQLAAPDPAPAARRAPAAR